MIVLAGADLVLPDRIVTAGTLRINAGRIAEIRTEPQAATSSSFAFHGYTIVPGFIDVHLHGVCGVDTLDQGDAVQRIAAMLPRFGVTAFCPTTVACSPHDLGRFLTQVRQCRETPAPQAARVLPAHLESNFINPDYRGAQPASCLRTALRGNQPSAAGPGGSGVGGFTADDILQVIEDGAPDVGIVTLAPEVAGAVALIERLVGLGIRVSLGHSGATFEQTAAAIAAGARQATHLFNRMAPLHHRTPGIVGAVLQSEEVAAEVICDGVHVHPALVRTLVAAKTSARVLAISDSTAASGLRIGATAALGGQRIVAGPSCALLADGTMAGGTVTLDGGFRRLTGEMGFSPVVAATMCATSAARELGLVGYGVIAEGAVADLAVLDSAGAVVQTYIGGRLVYARGAHEGNSTAASSV